MTGEFGLIWAVLGLPILGFLLMALLGKSIEKSLGRQAAAILAVLPVALSFGIGVMLTQKLIGLAPEQRMQVSTLGNWMDLVGFKIPFELVVDPLSITMVLIITGIGSLIFLYSTGYMAEEKDYTRFFTYLNLFVASMLILVLGNNLLLLFVGWEGVGLCSYLLIGFWYQDLANAKAANKAFIVNRVGDWGLTLGLFLLVTIVATSGKIPADGRVLSYDAIMPVLQMSLASQPALATAAALLLFVGACGKSAQFPLYLWLPDAMAGPTPVSALIHAATMVTSGVVLLNRMHIVFELSPIASAIVCAVGAFTALFAALVAFGQTDIKKVLAYSTVSQLGFMFIGAGSGAYWAGMFHVTTHAFFKALLFLGSGAVIHAMAHNQDMRNYGNLFKYLKITGFTMILGWLAISAIAIPGVFGFSGFYSKEALLGAAFAGEHAVVNGVNVGQVAGAVGLLTALLTAAYMTRMMLLTFFGNQERWRDIPAADHHGAHDDEHHHALDANHTPHEVSISMWLPLAVLAVLSTFGGWFLAKDEMFSKWLYPHGLPILKEVPTEPTNIPLGTISLVAAGLGILYGFAVYWKGLPAKEGWDLSKWSPLRKSAGNQFGYDALMVSATVDGGAQLAEGLGNGFDDQVVDGAVNGAGWIAGWISGLQSKLQTGAVRGYALLMLIGGIFFLGYFSYALAAVSHVGGLR